MLFLNILHNNPTKIHSGALVADTQKLIRQIVEDLKQEDQDFEAYSQSLIAPLFDLYMRYNQQTFNALSKALALDYCQNFKGIARDFNKNYRHTLKLHCQVWQDGQAAVYELVEGGKAGLEQFNGSATYHSFYTNVTGEMTSLAPVLEMVNAYLLSEIYAFLPILEEEGSIRINTENWETLKTKYREALHVFIDSAMGNHILSRLKFEDTLAI